MKKQWLFLLTVFLFMSTMLYAAPYTREKQIDINNAGLNEIMELPIDKKLARNIYDYITYSGYLKNIYELMNVKGMTAEIFVQIRPLIAVYPVKEYDPIRERYNRYYYLILQWTDEEGSQEGVVDEYIDLLRYPLNVNNITEEHLLRIPNVSPIDAAAVIRYLDEKGRLGYERQLRSVPGLTHYAYTNMRRFLVYSEEEKSQEELSIDYQYRMDNNYILDDMTTIFLESEPSFRAFQGIDEDGDSVYVEGNWYDTLGLEQALPAYQHKLRLRYKNYWKSGFMVFRNWGEEDSEKHYKYYLGLQNYYKGDFKLHNLVLGHYRVVIGQGLVMDNTDYYMPRKSGFGYNNRMYGVTADLSKTEEYALRGAAAEMSYKNLYSILFYSNDDKDAVLVEQGEDENGETVYGINNYITLQPGIDNETLEKHGFAPMRDVVTENTYGGYLKYKFSPGNYIGFSGYESTYDKYWVKKEYSQIISNTDKITETDAEYLAGYYNNDGKYRRVAGMDFGFVYNNVSLNGEIAKLFDVDDGLAYVIQNYWLFENFNMLLQYRNTDLDFDNPYNRSYSEKEKFNNTTIEKPYYLKSPIYGQLFSNAAQPQPEEGISLNARFAVTERITISKLFYDIYKLQADGKLYDRFEFKIDYKPIRNIRFQYFKKVLRGLHDNTLSTRTYLTNGDRFSVGLRLSGYNSLEVIYWLNDGIFPDRLINPFVGPYADGTVDDSGYSINPTLGGAREEGKAVFVKLLHNFTPSTRMILGGGVWKGGGFYSFDGSFFDSMDSDGKKFWVQFTSKISDNLSFSMFSRYTKYEKKTSYVRQYANLIRTYEKIGYDQFTYKVQLDYSW